ncbi:MAG TPA: FxLYD domain-containing protein, partial [Longimicrobiales bacterium]|nr:FxLYD domain-containing protein [Longimicrobiales bacterium]
HRMAGEFAGEETAGNQEALRLLETHDGLTVLVDQVMAVQDAQSNVAISGQVTNVKAEEGSTITLRFTLLDPEGAEIGQHDITVTAPAVDQTASFEGATAVEGEVAGWKYVVTP